MIYYCSEMKFTFNKSFQLTALAIILVAVLGILGESTILISQSKSGQLLCSNYSDTIDQSAEEDELDEREIFSIINASLIFDTRLFQFQCSPFIQSVTSIFSKKVKTGRDRCIEVHNLKMYTMMMNY